jgi:hypothetical protein
MEAVKERVSSFQREYLWELLIPETQLVALAEAVPEESYGWRPAEDARSFSEVMVHIAAGNLMLLYRGDVLTPEVMEMCGGIEGDPVSQWKAVIRKILFLEKTVTGKAAVLDLLKHSFDAVSRTFAAVTEEDLGKARLFFGETTTVRRFYLRMLAHSHEHMGQAIAYARTMGYRVPWLDPLKDLDRIAASASEFAA